MVIGDMGSVRPGVPTLTVALRGMAGVIVEVRTLAGPKHSGQFGGAAPDALLALIRVLASAARRQRRRRRRRAPARGVDGSELQRRGVPLARRGAGRHAVHRHRRAGRAHLVRARADGDRTSTRCPSTAPVNAVVPFARAKISARFHPEQDPLEGQAALVEHLEALQAVRGRDRGQRRRDGPGLLREDDRPAYAAAREALATAWGGETLLIATGGSIPLVSALSEAAPGRRDPDVRDDRRLREHPRAERARARRRVREGGGRRGRVLRPLRRIVHAGGAA